MIFLPGSADDGMEEFDWMKAAAQNPPFDFLAHPAEDSHTLDDGEPIEREK